MEVMEGMEADGKGPYMGDRPRKEEKPENPGFSLLFPQPATPSPG
jgi:hypothetical protein